MISSVSPPNEVQ